MGLNPDETAEFGNLVTIIAAGSKFFDAAVKPIDFLGYAVIGQDVLIKYLALQIVQWNLAQPFDVTFSPLGLRIFVAMSEAE